MSADTQKQEINKTAGQLENIACASCRRITKHQVLASADVIGSQSYRDQLAVEYEDNYQVIQCRGCETISFRTRSWSSEDYEVEEEGLSYNISTSLYPSRSEGRGSLKDTPLLPADIQRIYKETLSAINNDLPVLAGIGIRAIIESICRDKQAPGKDLFKRIEGLAELGVLSKDGADILHRIRSLGNEAAHEVKPHRTEQLSLALDVCENLFQIVYLLPHHAKTMFTSHEKMKLPEA